MKKFFKRSHSEDEKTPATRALLIGINYEGTSSELNGCINDVNNMYRFLTKECGYDASEIRVLTDEKHAGDRDQPTRHNILKGFRWLHKAVPKDGKTPVRLFVHYSGHGSWSRDTNGDEHDGRDESICPVDFERHGMIKDDDLRVALIDPIADKANVKLNCLFDCCHSGTILDLRYEFEVAVNANVPHRRQYKLLENKHQPKTKAEVVLFSGSLDKQYSADAWIAGKAQGAMTWGFLRVMRAHMARKKKVSFKQFLAEVQLLLKRSGYEQIPHLCSGHFLALKEAFEA